MVAEAIAPRTEYARRMQRVLDHIDTHLAEALELKALAAVAHFSPFHFHRVFAGWMGETLGDYLRRRRLERAAWLLRHHPAVPVLNVALEVGFGSGEAFARAFKLRYGAAPSAWRQRRNPDQADRNLDQAWRGPALQHDGIDPPMKDAPMLNVELHELPPVRVAALRHVGPYGSPIGEFWARRFVPWARDQQLPIATRYGLSYDDPLDTPPSQCRYDAAMEVPADYQPHGGAQMLDLPGGLYAVAHFHGASADIERAWPWLFKEWLPNSGYQIDDRPCFERQGCNDVGGGPGLPFSCDICIPVRPL